MDFFGVAEHMPQETYKLSLPYNYDYDNFDLFLQVE